MPLSIPYAQILSQFDALVAAGIVNHHPSRVTEIEDRGFKFKYEVTDSLANKPAAELAIQVPEHTPSHLIASRPEGFGSGSDIVNAHPDLLITPINDTHLLIINKFSVFRPQLLLLTIDSYQRQHVPLSQADLAAARSVLKALDDRFYLMFNCGETAGASRRHKHMQVIPHPDALPPTPGGWRLFPDYEPELPPEAISFTYFIQRFDNPTAPSEVPDLHNIYSYLLQSCRQSLKISDDGLPCSHNVVLTSKWMLLIPRARENVEGTTANSAGMMGSVWLRDEQQLQQWMKQGPAWVLSQLGVPAGEAA